MAEYTDRELNELLFKAIVPRGLRPETPEEIDAMLDAIGGEALPEATIQRMLRKVRGEEPLADAQAGHGVSRTDDAEAGLPAAELALYRNRNEEMPPEIEKLLEEMEEEALEDGEENDVDDENA